MNHRPAGQPCPAGFFVGNAEAMEPLPTSVLPAGVRARVLRGINGLDIHLLEAGLRAAEGRPAVLLLHGFPELAYSWRKVLPALAAAGYHAIAPDQRGYGRTTGWDADYDGDLAGFRFMNLLRDAIGVLFALGHRTAEAVVGHDFGASVAAYAALVRPDMFKRLVLMSAPFAGPPSVPFRRTSRRPPRRRTSMPRSPRSRGRASITSGTTRRGRPTRTCGRPGRACTISCAPTTITRAPTGKPTSRSS